MPAWTQTPSGQTHNLRQLDCCQHLIFFPCVKENFLLIGCTPACILTSMNGFISRALNEMWKCQNMLRGLVKELLDLHKLPVVSPAPSFSSLVFSTCTHYWHFPLFNSFHCQSEANSAAMLGKLMSIASKEEVIIRFSPCIQTCSDSKGCFMLTENLPDAGKAQDFMKKFNQVLGEDEKLRLQLEMLISPTCSCKQAETCVVSRSCIYAEKRHLSIQ